MKKIILVLFFSLSFLSLANFVLAAYELEIGLPDYSGNTPQAGDEVSLPEYINYLYIIGLGAIGVSALGMLVYGGFKYMLSDSVTNKSDAIKTIQSALLGLMIGLGAWLILNTINPALLENTPPTLTEITSTMPPSGDCYECGTLSVPFKNGNQVTQEVADRLEEAYNNRTRDWWVTEAWPATVTHQSRCHSIGTCVDVNLTNKSTDPDDVRAVFKNIQDAGLRPVYEHNRSCSAYIEKRVICIVVPQITAPHFSVYRR